MDLSNIVKDWSGDANLSGVLEADAAVDGFFWAAVVVSSSDTNAMHFMIVLGLFGQCEEDLVSRKRCYEESRYVKWMGYVGMDTISTIDERVIEGMRIIF